MSSSTLQVNGNNDLYLPDGRNLTLLTNIDACVQDVRLNCLMRYTENIYDVNEGVKYFEYIFTPQQSYDDARRSLATAILANSDVININSLTMDISGNTLTFTAQILTIYGQATVSN